MRCKNIKRMMNDFLDKMLTGAEEREVESHIAACESCRNELLKLKRADDALRTVVCEMVSEIKVPAGLNWKIEKALAARRKQNTAAGRLVAFLKNPAVAAALLFLMIAGSVFGYNNLFQKAPDRPGVVGQAPQNKEPAEGAADILFDRDERGATAVPEVNGKNKAPGTQEIAAVDSPGRKPGGEQLNNRPAENTREKLLPPPEPQAVERQDQLVSRQTQADTRDKLPGESQLIAGQAAQENTGNAPEPPVNKVFSIAGDFGNESDTGDLRKGTLDEAAAGASFRPAKPTYLPLGAELGEVSWTSGAINQNYRTGRHSFTVTQSRAEVGDQFDGGVARARQGTPVEINGVKAVLQETGFENTIRWQQGEWDYSISGALPREEIIRIAQSLR